MPSRILTPEQKELKKEYNRKWYEENAARVLEEKRAEYAALSPEKKEKKRRRAKKWYSENSEHIAAYRQRHKERDRRKANAHRIHKRYGLTEEEYGMLLDSQEGKCAICQLIPDTKRNLHVDHSHITGKVRALLCHYCNVAIGHFKENPEILHRAIAYLEKHSSYEGDVNVKVTPLSAR